MSDIEAFTALMKLSRTGTNNLIVNRWPDEAFERKWTSFIDYLKSFNDEQNSISEITDKKLQLLQKLLEAFISSPDKDIEIIRNTGKKNIPRIIYAIDRLQIGGKPFSDKKNHDYLIMFLNKIPATDYQKIAVPLLKFYLGTINPDNELKPIISTVFSSFDSSIPVYEKDINLYIDYEYIVSKIQQEKKATTLDEVLLNVGVSNRYISTIYMRSLFFKWFSILNRYNIELLQKNKTSLEECTSDEKKIVFASIINTTFARNSNTDKDMLIRQIDETFFPTPKIDKTEIEYWSLVTPILDNEKNQRLLKKAHRHYANIFTRFIITKFFDSLSDIASDRNGQVRANYWRSYGSSEDFVDIKIVINSWQRRKVFSGLTPSEITKFSKHIIRNTSEGISESPVFVIVFKTKTVAVFLQTGHSAQVFNSDNPAITNLIHKSYVDSAKDFSIYTSGSVYNNYNGQGRVIQNGYWQYNFFQFLSKYGIRPGKE